MGRITKFEHDQFGAQTKRILPTGAGETWEYNSFGELFKHLDFKGQREESIYDSLGRLQTKRWYADATTTVIGDQVAYVYDALGRLNSYTDSRGTTTLTYDQHGRNTKLVSPEGTIYYEYDAATGRHTRTRTQLNGSEVSNVEHVYDALGRVKDVKVHRRGGVAYATPETTSYRYTAVGDIDLVTRPNGIATEIISDALHRLQRVKHLNGAAIVAQYDYLRQNDGRITRVTELNNSGTASTTNYVYDEIGRLKTEQYDAVAAGTDYTTNYTLDLVGNRLAKETTLESGSVERITGTFSIRDWLQSETKTINGANPQTTNYGYDANGSLTSKTGPTESATYTWNLRNRLSGATVTRSGVTTTATYAYNDDGIRVRVTENGQTRWYVIDTNNPTGYAQVVEETTPTGTLLASYIYGLRRAHVSSCHGRITSRT